MKSIFFHLIIYNLLRKEAIHFHRKIQLVAKKPDHLSTLTERRTHPLWKDLSINLIKFHNNLCNQLDKT